MVKTSASTSVMFGFRDAQYIVPPAPGAVLYEPEILVIAALLQRELDTITGKQSGFFLMDGQPIGGQASSQMELKLRDGDMNRGVLSLSKNGRELAADSIDAILNYGTGGDDTSPPFSGWNLHPDSNGWVAPGIYCQGRHSVMVANATHGRFIMSLQHRTIQTHQLLSVYLTLVEALAGMGKEDVVLQHSRDVIVRDACRGRIGLREVSQRTRQWLAKPKQTQIPELRAWYYWHEPLNASGALSDFFLPSAV